MGQDLTAHSEHRQAEQVLARLAGKKFIIEGHFCCRECGHREIYFKTVLVIPSKWTESCSWCGRLGKVQIQ